MYEFKRALRRIENLVAGTRKPLPCRTVMLCYRLSCLSWLKQMVEQNSGSSMGSATRKKTILALVNLLLWLWIPISKEEHAVIDRESFPAGFIFGTSSSAYQVEGAAYQDGKTPSICDAYYNTPGHVIDGSNGNTAVEQYYLYPGDIEMMAKLGMDAYHMSISWSRMIPEGRGAVNARAVGHYNNVINDLVDRGIQPYVTLAHFDIPQALQDEYGGWLSPRIVNDFANYAEACFQLFGDRVKYWITISEPDFQAYLGYDVGAMPPGRCSYPSENCREGDSSREPYIAAHYQLLSHAAAVESFRKNERTKNSSIGLPLNILWYEALTNTSEDASAQSRALDFTLGWFLDPIFFGDYPKSMREIVGSRLPKFTRKEAASLKGSVDFVALNYYTTLYVADAERPSTPSGYRDDRSVHLTGVRNGVPIGPVTGFQTPFLTLYIVPRGMKSLVEHVKWRYDNPPIFILENGIGLKNDDSIPLEEALNDTVRVEFHRDHLSYLLQAMEDGANVKGYFVWSLTDDFEFSFGLTLRFGILHVDYKNPGLKRYPKRSALWFREFLRPELCHGSNMKDFM